MDGLTDVIHKSYMELDEGYQVLTVGLDPRESIDLAIKKKKTTRELKVLKTRKRLAIFHI